MESAAEVSVLLLKEADVSLGPGLTETQLASIESDFGFTFDYDHRELLSLATPSGSYWMDWLHTNRTTIEDRLGWPIEGIMFDVANNAFWPRLWGEKPSDEADREAVAFDHLREVPKLVPLYSHRYMAEGPSATGAPVFSAHQTDVIHYGANLPDYIAHELDLTARYPRDEYRHIPFWSSIVDGDPDYVDWGND
jgi:hypothetical protein